MITNPTTVPAPHSLHNHGERLQAELTSRPQNAKIACYGEVGGGGQRRVGLDAEMTLGCRKITARRTQAIAMLRQKVGSNDTVYMPMKPWKNVESWYEMTICSGGPLVANLAMGERNSLG